MVFQKRILKDEKLNLDICSALTTVVCADSQVIKGITPRNNSN